MSDASEKWVRCPDCKLKVWRTKAGKMYRHFPYTTGVGGFATLPNAAPIDLPRCEGRLDKATP